jgi:large subunit ribosomal protein L2
MKKYSPTTPSRRHMTTVTYRGVITHTEPHKPLTSGGKRDMGRNNLGRITVRHKGGGNKKLYRDVDFAFDKKNIPGKVVSVEYDPFRTSFISLVVYKDG